MFNSEKRSYYYLLNKSEDARHEKLLFKVSVTAFVAMTSIFAVVITL